MLAARKFLRNLKVWTWDFQRKITSDGEWAPCVFLALARKTSSSVFFFFQVNYWFLENTRVLMRKDSFLFFLFLSTIDSGKVYLNFCSWMLTYFCHEKDLCMEQEELLAAREWLFFAVLCTEFWVIDRFLIYILLIENVINCYGRC